MVSYKMFLSKSQGQQEIVNLSTKQSALCLIQFDSTQNWMTVDMEIDFASSAEHDYVFIIEMEFPGIKVSSIALIPI